MVLETFVAVNSTMLATRAINTRIEKEMKEKILKDSLYHVTTEENAKKIMESGYIKPSSNLLSLGRKKCFFFAGTPSYKDLSSNCASEAAKYEFKAIKLSPNEEELSKFRQRSFNDDSITFKGRCNLPEERAEVVDLVLDIDEKGNIFTREKTEEELEKYEPKAELVEKMNLLGNRNTAAVMSKAYINEYKTVGSKVISKLKNMFKKQDKTEYLPKANENMVYEVEKKNMLSDLKESVYKEEEMQSKYLENDNKEKEMNIEEKELL